MMADPILDQVLLFYLGEAWTKMADIKELPKREIECFIKSQELLEAPMEVVSVPYEGVTLTGYFYRSPMAQSRAPTLIVHQGRDAWAEDCKYIADGSGKTRIPLPPY